MKSTLIVAGAVLLGMFVANLRGDEPAGGRILRASGSNARLVALDNFLIVDVSRIVSAQYSGQQETLVIHFADVTGDASTIRYEGDTATRKWKALQRFAEQ